MRYPQLIVAGIAALLVTTGCGRVSSVQAPTPSGSKLAKPAGSTTDYKGATGTGGAGGNVNANVLLGSGQGTLTGKVIGATANGGTQGLAGVTVTVEPGALKLVTAADGSYRATVPAGTYTFSAKTTGYRQVSTNSVLVEGNGQASVPEILMVPGEGPSGVTSMSFGQELEYGRVGEPPATLVKPLGVAVRGGDVLVLDINSMPGVHTGIIRQYQGGDGKFVGKYGDYTKWLGLSQMKDTVKAIALDVQGRALVLDSNKQIWRFKPAGDKDKLITLNVEGACDMAVAPGGEIYVAGSGGITKLNAEGEAAQALGSAGDCKAVAAGKDSLWAIIGNKVVKLGTDGNSVMEFGAAGSSADRPVEFGAAADVAVDAKTGNIVVVDSAAKNVYVYDSVGTLIGKVGEGTFDNPVAAAFDATGRVFVVDQAKKKVYQFAVKSVR